MKAVCCDKMFAGIFQAESPILLYSAFDNALNLLCDDDVYAVIARNNYDAPATAVVGDPKLFNGMRDYISSYVTRRGSQLRFPSGAMLDIGECPIRDCELVPQNWNENAAKVGIARFDEFAANSSPTDCLMFYRNKFLGDQVEYEQTGRVLSDLLGAFITALEMGDNLEENAADLIGVGLGLTPSGDDFLCGFLCVCLSLPEQPKAQAWSRRLIACLDADHLVRRTTVVSASMLEHACCGQAASPYRQFCISLLSESRRMPASLVDLCNVGATSGRDFATGGACAARLLAV